MLIKINTDDNLNSYIINLHYKDSNGTSKTLHFNPGKNPKRIIIPDNTRLIYFTVNEKRSQSVIPTDGREYYLYIENSKLNISDGPVQGLDNWLDDHQILVGALVILLAFLALIFGLIQHRHRRFFYTDD